MCAGLWKYLMFLCYLNHCGQRHKVEYWTNIWSSHRVMYFTAILYLKSHPDTANWTHSRSFFISAHNETATKIAALFTVPMPECFGGSRGGDEIKISNRTRRLSPRAFFACYYRTWADQRNFNMPQSFEFVSHKMWCCPQLPSTVCHSMPRHSRTRLCLQQTFTGLYIWFPQPKICSPCCFYAHRKCCLNVLSFCSIYLFVNMFNQPITRQQVNAMSYGRDEKKT